MPINSSDNNRGKIMNKVEGKGLRLKRVSFQLPALTFKLTGEWSITIAYRYLYFHCEAGALFFLVFGYGLLFKKRCLLGVFTLFSGIKNYLVLGDWLIASLTRSRLKRMLEVLNV